MRTETLTLINSSVATSFSGGIYVDIPYDCRLVGINFSLVGAANAGASSEMLAECALAPVNQYGGGSGKGILATAANGGTTGYDAAVNAFVPMDVPMRAGQRVYLSCLNNGANWVRHLSVATLLLAS